MPLIVTIARDQRLIVHRAGDIARWDQAGQCAFRDGLDRGDLRRRETARAQGVELGDYDVLGRREGGVGIERLQSGDDGVAGLRGELLIADGPDQRLVGLTRRLRIVQARPDMRDEAGPVVIEIPEKGDGGVVAGKSAHRSPRAASRSSSTRLRSTPQA